MKTQWLDSSCCTAVLLNLCVTDSAGPDRMSPHVPPDEVFPAVQRNTEAMHLHAHDGQLVSPYFVFSFVRWHKHESLLRSHECLFSADSVRLVNEFNNMPVPSKTKQQGESSKEEAQSTGVFSHFLSETYENKLTTMGSFYWIVLIQVGSNHFWIWMKIFFFPINLNVSQREVWHFALFVYLGLTH